MTTLMWYLGQVWSVTACDNKRKFGALCGLDTCLCYIMTQSQISLVSNLLHISFIKNIWLTYMKSIFQSYLSRSTILGPEYQPNICEETYLLEIKWHFRLLGKYYSRSGPIFYNQIRGFTQQDTFKTTVFWGMGNSSKVAYFWACIPYPRWTAQSKRAFWRLISQTY